MVLNFLAKRGMWRCHWFLGIRGVTWGPVGQPCSLWNAFKLRCTKLMVDYIRLKCVGQWTIVLRHLFDLVLLIIFQCFLESLWIWFIHSLPLPQHIAPAVRQSQSATVGLFAWPCSICSKAIHPCGRGYLTVRYRQLEHREDRLPIGMFLAPQLTFYKL